MFKIFKTFLGWFEAKPKTHSPDHKHLPQWQVVKLIHNTNDNQRLEILQGPEQTYKYHVSKWMAACEMDEGVLGDGFWDYTEFSGHYGTLESCETDARQSVVWLRKM